MLDHLGEHAGAKRVYEAVSRSLNDRKVMASDLGGHATTSQLGNEVVRLLGWG